MYAIVLSRFLTVRSRAPLRLCSLHGTCMSVSKHMVHLCGLDNSGMVHMCGLANTNLPSTSPPYGVLPATPLAVFIATFKHGHTLVKRFCLSLISPSLLTLHPPSSLSPLPPHFPLSSDLPLLQASVSAVGNCRQSGIEPHIFFGLANSVYWVRSIVPGNS